MAQGTAAYAEQANALAEGGADVLWIETVFSFEEMTRRHYRRPRDRPAGDLHHEFRHRRPDHDGHHPGPIRRGRPRREPAAGRLRRQLRHRPLGVAGGADCNMREAADPDDILVTKSNCGVPEFVDGEIAYQGTPELMADYARLCLDAGARIIGGCCGTTPEHIRIMRAAMESHTPGAAPGLETIIERLGQISKGAEKQFRALSDK